MHTVARHSLGAIRLGLPSPAWDPGMAKAGPLYWEGLLEGDIAQLGERGVRNAEVGGSTPPISTNVPL